MKIKSISSILLLSMICISLLYRCITPSQLAIHRQRILSGVEAIGKLNDLYDAYNREFAPKEEYYIGRTISAYLLNKESNYGVGKSGLEQYINKIGHTLAMASQRPETYQDYRFIILNSPKVNAFAVPSGFIFITTGLINIAENEDELAGALAHEISHIVLKHPTKSISEAHKSEAISNLVKISITTAVAKDQSIRNATKVFGGVIDEVRGFVLKGYDTTKEKEADLHAVQIMINAGYNPSGLKTILEKLKKPDSLKGGGVHGDPFDRARDVKNEIEKQTFIGAIIPKFSEKRSSRFKSIKGSAF